MSVVALNQLRVHPGFAMEPLRNAVQKCSDPYEFYELRHPLDRTSPVVQSHLVRQPGIASKHTPFHRVVVEDSQDPASLGESPAGAATYPRPFCMPSQESLMDPLTDDESTLTFASCTSYDHNQRETNGDWQSLLDLETMKVPVVTGDFLSDITWNFPEHATAARRREVERHGGNAQDGHPLRSSTRFGCSVLRRVHASPIPGTPPTIRAVAEGETSSGTPLADASTEEKTSSFKTGRWTRSNPRGAFRKMLGRGADSPGFRERLGMSSECGGGYVWRSESNESTQGGEPSLRDTESVSTRTSKEWLTSFHVSEPSLSLTKWKRSLKKTKSPTHRVAKDVCFDRWSTN